jgi:hypothetical protein
VKFEIRYPTGTRHEIELEGTVATVGRDPTCDIVVNDAKCSRRHAVLEAGAQGIAIRDTGSANGVMVNGRRVERAALDEGDVVQLGDVSLKVLPENVPMTLLMGEDEAPGVIGGPPHPSPKPPPPRPLPQPAGVGRGAGPASFPDLTVQAPPAAAPVPPPLQTIPSQTGPIPRPLTIALLSALFLVGGLLAAVGGLAWTALGHGGWAPLLCGLGLLVLGTAVGAGLWQRTPWARLLLIATAGVSIFTCVFLPTGVAVLIYALRSEVRLQFMSRGDLRGVAPRDVARVLDDSSDLAFAGAILGSLLVCLVLAIAAAVGVRAVLG